MKKNIVVLATASVLLLAMLFGGHSPASVLAQSNGTNSGTVEVVPSDDQTPQATQAQSTTPSTQPAQNSPQQSTGSGDSNNLFNKEDNGYAAILNRMCAGANFDINSSCSNLNSGQTDALGAMSNMIKSIVNLLSIIVGVVAVFMIIIGGLRYITSGGDSSNVNSAKNTILYAIVGLVVVAMSQVIVQFVIGKLTAATS